MDYLVSIKYMFKHIQLISLYEREMQHIQQN